MIVHIQGRFKIAKYDRAVRSKNRSCTNDRIFLEILILNPFLVLKEWILKDKTASNHAIKLLENGADIIDVGGESTRPGAVEVSEKEEISRVLPVIKQIRNISPDTLISIDTTKSNVARCAIEAGANIINDISGLTKDPAMVEIGAEFQVPIVIMHMQGNPVNMQNKP